MRRSMKRTRRASSGLDLSLPHVGEKETETHTPPFFHQHLTQSVCYKSPNELSGECVGGVWAWGGGGQQQA